MTSSQKEALLWLRKAAVRGGAEAQYLLAGKYAAGQGAPRDDPGAVNWYQQAARQGHPGAQFELGNFYASGRGVSRNDKEAAQWYRCLLYISRCV